MDRNYYWYALTQRMLRASNRRLCIVSSIYAETDIYFKSNGMIRLKTLLTEISSEEAAYYANHPGHKAPTRYDITQYAPRIAAQFGETVSGAPLGEGSFGVAYPLASGKVMKLTPDTGEVATAAHFRTRRKTPHIMSYYDARAILPQNGYNQFFALIMDRVTPLKYAEQTVWNDISSPYFDTEMTPRGVWSYYTQLRAERDWSDVDEFVRTICAQRDAVLRAVNSFGVHTYEAHGGNVGFDAQGRFTIFDMWSDRGNDWKITASLRKMNKAIDLTPYLNQAQPDSTGIDTPGDPTM